MGELWIFPKGIAERLVNHFFNILFLKSDDGQVKERNQTSANGHQA